MADTALGRRRAAHRDLSAAPWLPETREHSTHDRNPHDDLIREDVNEVNRVHESCMEFVILILIAVIALRWAILPARYLELARGACLPLHASRSTARYSPAYM